MTKRNETKEEEEEESHGPNPKKLAKPCVQLKTLLVALDAERLRQLAAG